MNSVQYNDFPTGNNICLRTALPGEDVRGVNCSFPQLLSRVHVWTSEWEKLQCVFCRLVVLNGLKQSAT